MNGDTCFRIVFGVFWLAHFVLHLLPYLQYRRFFKSPTTALERQGFLLTKIMTLTNLFMLLYVLTDWIDFARIPLPSSLRWSAGSGLLTAYSIIYISSRLLLARNRAGANEDPSPPRLVTSGLYRFVRHPMYSAVFISPIGFLILSANWLVAAPFFIVLTIMYRMWIDFEEESLISIFGDEYRQYMKRTGRLIPRF